MYFPALYPLLCITPEFSTHLDELRAYIKLCDGSLRAPKSGEGHKERAEETDLGCI